jgi:hypothetical protein
MTTTSETKRIPLGVALKCEHACCGGSGEPSVTVLQPGATNLGCMGASEAPKEVSADDVRAIYFAMKELAVGLEDLVVRLRGGEKLSEEELDGSLAEATTCAREIQYATGLAIGIDVPVDDQPSGK